MGDLMLVVCLLCDLCSHVCQVPDPSLTSILKGLLLDRGVPEQNLLCGQLVVLLSVLKGSSMTNMICNEMFSSVGSPLEISVRHS